MSERDHLLFGAEPVPAPDSDGDGVSDAQERLDGTDPTDASSVKHADPVVDPSTAIPALGDLGPATAEHDTVVDVVGAAPAGFTADQGLATGLDGKPIASSPGHYGVGDDTLLAGRADGGVDVSRDPTVVGQTAGSAALAGGVRPTLPSGETQSGSTDPSTNIDLVAGKSEETSGSVATGAVTGGAATAAAAARPEPTPAAAASTELQNLDLGKLVKFSDPDGGGVGGPMVAPTAGEVSHAVTVHGGATDVVQGFGGTQIEGDAPPLSKRDLVTDPADPKGSADVPTSTSASAPAVEISHTINPDSGFDVTRGPSGGPGPGTGVGDGFASTSSAATAATASASSSETSGISVVGSGSSGAGIHSVADDVTGAGSESVVKGDESSGGGGVDDARAVESAAGAVEAGSESVAKGDESSGGGGVDDARAVESAAGAVEAGSESVAKGDEPSGGGVHDDGSETAAAAGDLGVVTDMAITDVASAAGDAPVPLDPVADAMVTVDVASFHSPADSLPGLDLPDDLAVPDQVDLDDGF